MPMEIEAQSTPPNPFHLQLIERLNGYLRNKGIADRNRAALVAEVVGLSALQARRRMSPTGPGWNFDELAALAAHFGDPLVALLPLDALNGSGGPGGEALPCEIEVAGRWYAATARVGGQAVRPKLGELVAVEDARRWRLLPVEQVAPGTPHFAVSDVRLLPQPSHNTWIAILDDDLSMAESLRQALLAEGYVAEAFADEAPLVERAVRYDAFIIDFVLSPGQTAAASVERIRKAKPHAPIIVLTGHARDESTGEIAALARSFGVDIQEKPAQIVVLTSLIDGKLASRFGAAPPAP